MEIKKECIIVDLEGTITDCSKRIESYITGDFRKWRSNFRFDPPNKLFMNKLYDIHLTFKYHIIMSTAKSIEDASEVNDWLHNNILPSGQKIGSIINKIYYRSGGDERRSKYVKKDHLKLIEKEYVVKAAYDDTKENVIMYSDNGITSYIVSNSFIRPFLSSYKEGIEGDENYVESMLKECIGVFNSRNKEYGNSYKDFGNIMKSLFPEGIVITKEEDFSRFAILTTILSKIDRYCANFFFGGHEDSLKDIIVYSSMLNELDNDYEEEE